MKVDVRPASDRNRYEIRVDGSVVGIADYVDRDERRLFTHTEIHPRVGGQGLGEKLVRYALDDTERRGLEPVGLCSFVAHVQSGNAVR
jgi:predicted GNAT family acetyltransferase